MENKTLAELHEEIFQFLYQKHEEDENFMFRVRQTNNKGRLNKGYWFNGNDEYLYTSFWSGNDSRTGFYHIRLTITKDTITKYYDTSNSEVLENFFNILASLTDLKRIKQVQDDWGRWRKIIEVKNNNHLEIINNFIKKDKLIIDTFINNALKIENKDLDDLGFIQKEEFKEWIENMRRYRNFNKDNVSIKSIKSIDYTQYPIELKLLKLKNIGSFQSFELDLSKRVICVLGENGIGKTTILRALVLALIGVETDEKNLFDLQHPKLQRMLTIKGKNERNNIQYTENGKIELTYNHGEPVKNEIMFSPELSKEARNFVNIYSEGNDEFVSFTATKDAFEFTQLIIGFSQSRGENEDKNEKSENEDKNKKDKTPAFANIHDVLPLLYNKRDTRFGDLAQWIISLHFNTKDEKYKSNKDVLEKLFELVSEITETKIKFASATVKEDDFEKANENLWIKIEDNTPILFSLLSSGYQSIFTWVGIILKRVYEANDYVKDFHEKPAIVIIDEIDTYLHPKWQRNILNVLAKTFVNTRFIVTTHSPLVVNHLEVDDKAVFMVRKNGSVEKITYIEGVTTEDAFYSWMGVDFRNENTQKEIDELFKFLNKEDLEKAKPLYKKLKLQIGEHDKELLIAKNEIELIEEFGE